jgi:hypothetical protein
LGAGAGRDKLILLSASSYAIFPFRAASQMSHGEQA